MPHLLVIFFYFCFLFMLQMKVWIYWYHVAAKMDWGASLITTLAQRKKSSRSCCQLARRRLEIDASEGLYNPASLHAFEQQTISTALDSVSSSVTLQ